MINLLHGLTETLPVSAERADHLDRWMADSDRTTPVSSNQPSVEIPFQRWFKFKEAFSPQFIVDCAKSMDRFPRSCLDPFGGSGTTALTCQFLGIRPTTIEVNPFLADLIAAKLASYDLEKLKRDYLRVLTASRSMSVDVKALLTASPDTLVEPGRDARWVFSKSSAERILAIREATDKIRTESHRSLLRAVLGSVLVSLSNVVVNGKGRKYRRGWETRQKFADDVDTAFRESFLTVYTDLAHFGSRPRTDFTLLRGDSRELIGESEPVDCVIFSPPYPNSFDYTDIYNLELWMLGYLRSRNDNSALRNRTVRSHVQLKRDYSGTDLGSPELKRAYAKICRHRAELWNRDIPEMVLAYFGDMHSVLRDVRKKLRRGGRAFLAVGNSKYAGVIIDTATILTELAPSVGFTFSHSEPIRSMRASAQQGGRAELSESLIVLA